MKLSKYPYRAKKVWVNPRNTPAFKADATNFIRKKLRTQLYYRKKDLYSNFKSNLIRKYRNFKVGWTAPLAKGSALKAQYKWRKAYFKTHGRVI